MAATADIPVIVPADAAAWVAELGMRREFDMMLDHLKRTVPGLRKIVVEVDHETDMWEAASVILWTHRTDPGPGDDPTDRGWRRWYGGTFPADVCRHFVRLDIFESADGR